MFKQRFGLDLAFYNNITRNQILDVPMDQTTGYTKATMNSGKVRNRGIELQLDGTPVKTKNYLGEKLQQGIVPGSRFDRWTDHCLYRRY